MRFFSAFSFPKCYLLSRFSVCPSIYPPPPPLALSLSLSLSDRKIHFIFRFRQFSLLFSLTLHRTACSSSFLLNFFFSSSSNATAANFGVISYVVYLRLRSFAFAVSSDASCFCSNSINSGSVEFLLAPAGRSVHPLGRRLVPSHSKASVQIAIQRVAAKQRVRSGSSSFSSWLPSFFFPFPVFAWGMFAKRIWRFNFLSPHSPRYHLLHLSLWPFRSLRVLLDWSYLCHPAVALPLLQSHCKR